MYAVFFIALLCLGVSGDFLNCDWVTTLDCADYDVETECGTDGRNYDNRCFFAQAQCSDKELHILHHGECLGPEASPPSFPAFDGEEVILDFFCVNLFHQECHQNSTDTSKVCATDGWTYENYCEYEKARCTHRDLHVASFGDCP